MLQYSRLNAILKNLPSEVAVAVVVAVEAEGFAGSCLQLQLAYP